MTPEDMKQKHNIKAAGLASAFHAYAEKGVSLIFEDGEFYIVTGKTRGAIGSNINVAGAWLLEATSATATYEVPKEAKFSKKEKE